jgi:hypothetical protein
MHAQKGVSFGIPLAFLFSVGRMTRRTEDIRGGRTSFRPSEESGEAQDRWREAQAAGVDHRPPAFLIVVSRETRSATPRS